MSNPKSDQSSLKSPILWIDFRSGSVAMLLDSGETWWGKLPWSSADQSQCNTAQGVCQLEKTGSAWPLANEG
jgi:hypothetical protein